MSSLTPASFSAAQQDKIQERIDAGAQDVAHMDGLIVAGTTEVSDFQVLDAANQLVQDQAISDIVAILHQIVKDRDIAEPGEAPHVIKFLGGFPVALANLGGGDPFPVIPGYVTPLVGKSVSNGLGWELWHTPVVTLVLDPAQPSAGELTVDYPDLVTEFNDFQTTRLHNESGSFVLVSRFSSNLAIDTAKKALIQNRNAFYISIGFVVTP